MMILCRLLQKYFYINTASSNVSEKIQLILNDIVFNTLFL